MTPLPNARESFVSELSGALTDRENGTLYDMLVDATLAQIKVESFLIDGGLSVGAPFDRAADTVSELMAVRDCLTQAWHR